MQHLRWDLHWELKFALGLTPNAKFLRWGSSGLCGQQCLTCFAGRAGAASSAWPASPAAPVRPAVHCWSPGRFAGRTGAARSAWPVSPAAPAGAASSAWPGSPAAPVQTAAPGPTRRPHRQHPHPEVQESWYCRNRLSDSVGLAGGQRTMQSNSQALLDYGRYHHVLAERHWSAQVFWSLRIT